MSYMWAFSVLSMQKADEQLCLRESFWEPFEWLIMQLNYNEYS